MAKKNELDKVSPKFWKGETFRVIAGKVATSRDVSAKVVSQSSDSELFGNMETYILTDGRLKQAIHKEVYDHIQTLKAD